MGRRARIAIGRRDFVFGALSTAAWVGMGGMAKAPSSASGPSSDVPASMPFAKPPVDAVVGRILYDGKPPEPAVIDCSVDPHCALLYRKEPLRDETLLVGKRRGLLNYVKSNDVQRYRSIIESLGLRR